MEYTTKITNIPENGVTIAQIHNRGGVKRPYVRIYIEEGEVKIKETTSYPSDNNNKTYKNYDDNILKYTEGTNITVKIETKDGTACIMIITTHGSFSETLNPNRKWNKFSNDYYLKAGVYTEGNDVKPVIPYRI